MSCLKINIYLTINILLRYVTAFHEDTPNVGIFTYRLKGFKTQPTDHYMRNFLLYTETKTNSWSKYCNGEIPRHKLMMDYITQVRQIINIISILRNVFITNSPFELLVYGIL